MKPIILTILLSLLVACEGDELLKPYETDFKENTVIETAAEDPCSIIIDSVFQVNVSKYGIAGLYYSEKEIVTFPDYCWLISEYKGHYFNVLFDDDTVRQVMYYGDFIPRSKEYDPDFIQDVVDMYEYGFSWGIFWNGISISEMFHESDNNKFELSMYASYSCGDITYGLYGCRWDSTRSVVLTISSFGYDIITNQ